MKKILLLAILITIADTTFATVIVCDHESSGVTVTGVWEFVYADGSVSNATWTHDNVDRRCLRSQEGIDYAKSRGKTGLLSMWWDKDKKRPHHFEEYLDGQKNGYSTALYTNGRIAFVGQFCKGMVVSGMWLRKDGTRSAEIIWKGDTGVSIDRDAHGRIKSIEDFVPGHLPEERRISTNKNLEPISGSQ